MTSELMTAQLAQELRQAIDNASKKIGKYIYDAYDETARRFYAHYSPRQYARTNGFEKALKTNMYWEPSMGGNTYIVGIEGGSRFIPSGNYKADTDWVFSRTWSQGIHGWTIEEYNKWNKMGIAPFTDIYPTAVVQRPSPMAYMNQRFRDINLRLVGNILNSEIGKVLK